MLNRVVLVGRTTKDTELRYTGSGVAVASFTLAVNRQKRDEVDFINCVAWQKLAETCGQYLGKGRLVALEGRLQIRNYEKDGHKVYVAEVHADNVRFLDRGDGGAQSQGGSAGDYGDPFAED